MRQIINAANALELDAGHVLKATATDEDDVVLLQIVSNAGDIRNHLLSGRKSHQNAFSVGGIRLSRLLDEHLQNDSFREWLAVQWLTWRAHFEVRAGSVHLINRCHVASRYR